MVCVKIIHICIANFPTYSYVTITTTVDYKCKVHMYFWVHRGHKQ